jgi:adenine-specific DNA-methyltransferase
MPQIVQRIWHGDSRELCDKFKPGRVNCVITDPPFGIDNQSNMAKTAHGATMARKIAGDRSPEEAIALFNEVMDVLLPKTSADCDMYIFTAEPVMELWLAESRLLEMKFGFKRKATLVWAKDGPGMGDLDSWGQGHEFILYLKKGRRPSSDTRRSGVLHVPQIRPGDLVHPHEKPEQLLEYFIRHSTDEGDFIVDPFGGSGSLARAARSLDRSAVSIEYDQFNFERAMEKFDATAGAII